jgi:predicted deacylase
MPVWTNLQKGNQVNNEYIQTEVGGCLKRVEAELSETKKKSICRILKIIGIIVGGIFTAIACVLGILEALQSLGWLEPIKAFILQHK